MEPIIYTSQFFSHGFAIYVNWTKREGRDQFGFRWFIRGGYAIDENFLYKFKM